MLPVPDPFAQTDRHDLVIRAEPGFIRAALLQVARVPPVAALGPSQRATVELALAEVLNNIAEHAYADRPGHVKVTVALHDGGLWCQMVDEGAPMPGGNLPEGGLPDNDLPEGGFGWHLIRSMTCGLRYRRRRGTNRLTFVIPLDAG